MPEYLLELYVARADAPAVDQGAARVRRAAEEYSREGTPIRYLRSIFVPEDETCFLLFDAVDAASVQEALVRAGLPYERITDAVTASGAGR